MNQLWVNFKKCLLMNLKRVLTKDGKVVQMVKEDSMEAKEDSTEAKEDSAEVKEDSMEAKEDSMEAKEDSTEAKEDSTEAKEDKGLMEDGQDRLIIHIWNQSKK